MSCTQNIVVFLFVVSNSVLWCCNAASIGRSGCQFSINSHLKDPQPLILLQNDATTYPEAFPQPVDKLGNVVLAAGDAIDVACPGGNSVIVGGVDTKLLVVEASCIAGTTFSVQGVQVDFTQLVCKGAPQSTARYTRKKCAGNYREIEIGFHANNKFIRHLTVCYDEDNRATLYSIVNVTKTIEGFQSGYPRPKFLEGNFFNTSPKVNALYERKQQRTTVNTLLGLNATDKTYIQDGNNYYLAKGHLAAKADVIYGSQQNLTFYYVNVAPQWQTFNGGNWNTLEGNTRRFATSRSIDLEVYTGTYGVSTLPDKKGVQKKLYLYTPSNGQQFGIPIPAVFYKVVYDPISKTGVAFVGLNNPYKTDVEEDVHCKDVCDQIDWLTWNKDDYSLGYSYCCEIDDLRKTITYIPKLDVRGVLK